MYRSVTTCTTNGIITDVRLEYRSNFWRLLFNRKPKVESYVGSGTVWYNKNNGKRVSTCKEREIMDAIKWVQIQELTH